jgi:hypothetical protein
MKYNNGDMDDLFRRASERYPLRTDSADWDKLAGALDGGPTAPSDDQEKRRRRGVFWWFLLIPLAGIGYWMGQTGMHRSLEKSVTKATPEASGGDQVSGENQVSAGDQVSGGNKVSTGGVSTAGGSGVPGGSDVPGGEKVRKTRTSDGKTANVGAARNSVGVGRQEVVESGVDDEGVSGGGKVRNLRTPGGSTGRLSDAGLGTGSSGDHSGETSSGDHSRETSSGDHSRETFSGERSTERDLALAELDLRRAPIGVRYGVNVDVVAPTLPVDSKKPRSSSGKHLSSHGYIGVFGAPDFSTVRFQSMKGIGTTFGVLLGYSFNDRWAVESGLSMDRKKYYTAGEYFKKEMPPGYTLLNVDGTCNMLEIPVNVRYNFSRGARMKWFATAGLSTYLMSKENYNYQYSTNWVTGDSNWSIHKPSQYWFSIINLSAGFEQRVGKIGNLRFEPYVRIPLSGIGTGKLPIVSGGLNIGLVRDLW